MSGQRRTAAKLPAAISPIATLPVFFKLRDKLAVVAGGTAPAAWKAELLAAAGARVLVLAAEPEAEMARLAEALPERVSVLRRPWNAADLAGAAIAIGACEGEEGEAFRDAAQVAGVPVNVIDVPRLCDFQFGTIVARSPLVIGISTDGAAPVFGQALRSRIEALLPAEMGAWAVAAQAWRESLQPMKLDFAARRRFWETFADLAFAAGDRAPGQADRLLCLEAATGAQRLLAGRVILVGSGPGPLEGVTLGAVRALQTADVVVYEPQVLPAVLGLARREARRDVADASPVRTRDIIDAVAGSGRTVVWIGPGDPDSCEAWAVRRQALEGLAASIETVHGLRCDGCAIRCSAPGPPPGQ